MPCTNETGTHKLKLMFVEKSKNNLDPIKILKQKLPVITKHKAMHEYHVKFLENSFYVPHLKEFLQKKKNLLQNLYC